MGSLHVFRQFLQRETIFVTSCLLIWRMKSSQNGNTLKKEFGPMGENSFLEELIHMSWEAKIKIRVASPESVLIHRNLFFKTFELKQSQIQNRASLKPTIRDGGSVAMLHYST